MANPLYEVLGGSVAPGAGMEEIMRQFEQMKKTFRGDPRMEVQRLISSGQMTNEQFNRLGQMASQIMKNMR